MFRSTSCFAILFLISFFVQANIPLPLDLKLMGNHYEVDGFLSESDEEYWAIEGGALLPLLSNYLRDDKFIDLQTSFNERILTAQDFAKLGWQVHYSVDDLSLELNLPVSDLKTIDVDMIRRANSNLPLDLPTAETSFFSGVINLGLSHSHDLNEFENYADVLSLRTGINFAGITLEDGHSYFYQKGNSSSGWQRDNSRLMADLPQSLGFLQLGDYRNNTQIEQFSSHDIFGLSYTFQPEYLKFYNRPNTVPLTLENSALVHIKINGEEYKTIRLAAGQYNINDLPIENGINDVEISYLGNGGIDIVEHYNLVNHPELLLKNDFETQWAVGYLQEYNEEGVKEIDEQALSFQGIISYGLTDWWTISPQINWLDEEKFYQIDNSFLFQDSFLDLKTEINRQTDFTSEKITLSYFTPEFAWQALSNFRVSYYWDHQKQQTNHDRHGFSLSTGINLPLTQGYLSASLNQSMDGSQIVNRGFSLNASYRLPYNISLSTSFRWRQNDNEINRSIYGSLSIPLNFGGLPLHGSMRTSYNSETETYNSSVGVSKYQQNQNFRASLNFIDENYESLDAFYQHRGSKINTRLSASTRNESSDSASRSASVGVDSAIVWAGNQVAWSKPIYSGFTIVGLPNNAEEYALEASRFGKINLLKKENGGSSKVVIPVNNRGSRIVQINSDELDFDRELTTVNFGAYGGLRHGSWMELEILSGYFVLGQLVQPSGENYRNVTGELISQDGQRQYPFFTDEEGNFELDMLPLGDYALILHDHNQIAQIQVAAQKRHDETDKEDDFIIIELGQIQLSDKQS